MKTAIRKHLIDFLAVLGLVLISAVVAVNILSNQRLTLPPELEADFNRIYDTQHIPEIMKVPGVLDASVNLASEQASVTYVPSAAGWRRGTVDSATAFRGRSRAAKCRPATAPATSCSPSGPTRSARAARCASPSGTRRRPLTSTRSRRPSGRSWSGRRRAPTCPSLSASA